MWWQTKRNIPHAWKLFAIWRRVKIPSCAPSLTWVIVKSLIAYELAHGKLEMAVILGLAFHCLLRPGEFLALTLSDIQLGTTSGICSLKCTKSGCRNAAADMVSITDPCILDFMFLRITADWGDSVAWRPMEIRHFPVRVADLEEGRGDIRIIWLYFTQNFDKIKSNLS